MYEFHSWIFIKYYESEESYSTLLLICLKNIKNAISNHPKHVFKQLGNTKTPPYYPYTPEP